MRPLWTGAPRGPLLLPGLQSALQRSLQQQHRKQQSLHSQRFLQQLLQRLDAPGFPQQRQRALPLRLLLLRQRHRLPPPLPLLWVPQQLRSPLQQWLWMCAPCSLQPYLRPLLSPRQCTCPWLFLKATWGLWPQQLLPEGWAEAELPHCLPGCSEWTKAAPFARAHARALSPTQTHTHIST